MSKLFPNTGEQSMLWQGASDLLSLGAVAEFLVLAKTELVMVEGSVSQEKVCALSGKISC